MGVELLQQYFTSLTPLQLERFAKLEELYADWNSKINLISRKDFDHFYERHVLHSLAIAKLVQFNPGQTVLDIGTGGGFPGIPLAILFPDTQFTLCDSIQKKIKVVQAVAEDIELTNVTAVSARVETLKQPFDYAVTRAVAPVPELLRWMNIPLKPIGKKQPMLIKNAMYCLKGGDLSEEIEHVYWPLYETPIPEFYKEDFFETKKVVEIRFT